MPPAPGRQGARAHRGPHIRPHRHEGVDAGLRQAQTIRVRHSHRGAQPGSQDRLFAFGSCPHRQVSSERAIIPAAAPQEANVSIRPRRRSNACTRGKKHYCAVAAERPDAQRIQRRARRQPRGRRIDEQHRLPVATELRGHEQRAQADVVVASERRDAQHVETGALEREHAGAFDRRADDIVVGERSAIVAVRIRHRIADRHAARTASGSVGPIRRDCSRDANEARLEQHVDNASSRVRHDRNTAEKFPGLR